MIELKENYIKNLLEYKLTPYPFWKKIINTKKITFGDAQTLKLTSNELIFNINFLQQHKISDNELIDLIAHELMHLTIFYIFKEQLNTPVMHWAIDCYINHTLHKIHRANFMIKFYKGIGTIGYLNPRNPFFCTYDFDYDDEYDEDCYEGSDLICENDAYIQLRNSTINFYNLIKLYEPTDLILLGNHEANSFWKPLIDKATALNILEYIFKF